MLTFGISSFPPTSSLEQCRHRLGHVKLCIYRGLLSYGPDGKMRGELAESWRPKARMSGVQAARRTFTMARRSPRPT